MLRSAMPVRLFAAMVASLLALAFAASVGWSAHGLEQIDLALGGGQPNGSGTYVGLAITPNGRYVAFSSYASNLVAGDGNVKRDVFVRDRQTATTVRASCAANGSEAWSDSWYPSISDDGRYVAFLSYATNLVANDTNAVADIFLKDLQTGAIVRISTDSSGTQADKASTEPYISGDGTCVAFTSSATNLVTGDTNASDDVFVKVVATGAISRMNIASSGTPAGSSTSSLATCISYDGRYVGFYSTAANLVSGDTNSTYDGFLHDRQTGATICISTTSGGAVGNDISWGPSIDRNVRYVTFDSYATNLVAGDANGKEDVFVKDLTTGTVTLVSVTASGQQGNDHSMSPSISGDGGSVAFISAATNFVASDTNTSRDVFLNHWQTGTGLMCLSMSSAGVLGNGHAATPPRNNANGSAVVFRSSASNLGTGDTDTLPNVFLATEMPLAVRWPR